MRIRAKVAAKIWLGCAIIVGLGCITLVAAYRGLIRVRSELRHLADVNEPIKAATHEMEINIKGIAIGTLGYLNAPSAISWELVKDNETDFERFHADYFRLATTDRERELGQAVGRLYARLKTNAGELKAARDKQAEHFADVLSRLETMDDSLEKELQGGQDAGGAGGLVKLDTINTFRRGLAEIGMLVAAHGWFRRYGARGLAAAAIENCQAGLERLEALEWTAEEREALQSLKGTFQETMLEAEEVLSHKDEIERGTASFIHLRDEIDSLLDEQMQPLAFDLVQRPRRDAEAAAASAAVEVGALIAIFLAAAAIVSLRLHRTVSVPLQSLTRGTEVVSRGDLTYRVPLVSTDEFSILTLEFNHMVARLQETLVSKEKLERSEGELKRTVLALQQEISERMRGEKERMRLEASLRRAETLSAMGALVAGVAHQVRNPLFGTSSVLDAMEARLGQREEYQPYLDALRDSISRMNVLMQELMEYGRPGTSEPSPGSIGDVIRDAVCVCQKLAQKAQVTIEEQIAGEPATVLMDRSRLSMAIENLIENAIQHSSPGSTVLITARDVAESGGGCAEVCVEDSGPGFDEADRPRLFEPFFTRRKGGIGLGLALVQRIVESHGGQVEAGHRPGGGASMRIRLPRERSCVSSVEVPSASLS